MRDTIRHKLTHGVPPLTLDESRWLYAQAFGEHIVTRKRCPYCEGEGTFETVSQQYRTLCPLCFGTGFEPRALATPVSSQENPPHAQKF